MKKENIKQLIYSYITIIMASFVFTFKATDKYLAFLDTYTFMGFFLLLIGALNWLALKGDFDIFRYFSNKMANFIQKDAYTQDYASYHEEREAKRENKINIPMYLGIFVIVTALVLTYFY